LANIGHGHVFPRDDGVVARCGGPAICRGCALDYYQKMNGDVAPIPEPAPWARVPVDAQFLAEVFDAFAGADAYNLVVKIAMERLKQ